MDILSFAPFLTEAEPFLHHGNQPIPAPIIKGQVIHGSLPWITCPIWAKRFIRAGSFHCTLHQSQEQEIQLIVHQFCFCTITDMEHC